MLHCWTDKYETLSAGLRFGSPELAEVYIDTHESHGGNGGTCMLEAGHAGPHEWTPDGEMPMIEFKPLVEVSDAS